MLNAGGGFSGRRDTERLLSNLNRKIKNADIPAKDKAVYQKSINGLKEIFYFGGDLVKGYGQLVNRVEYASRLGEFNLAKKAGMIIAAKKLIKAGAKNVIIKGGHLKNRLVQE